MSKLPLTSQCGFQTNPPRSFAPILVVLPHAPSLVPSGAELPYTAFIIQAYGVVLSPFPDADQEQGNLSRALGSVVGTACLRAETRVGPQLTSHVFGLLKARNVEGLSDGDKWLSSDEGTEWVIK